MVYLALVCQLRRLGTTHSDTQDPEEVLSRSVPVSEQPEVSISDSSRSAMSHMAH